MKRITQVLLIIGCFLLSNPVKAERLVLSLNGKWSFMADSLKEGEKKMYMFGLPLKFSREVIVPHTWSVMDGFDQFNGKCWYSRAFQGRSEWRNKDIRLKFSAVYRDAVIFLNGKKVGEHLHSGYTAFYVDVSDCIKYDSENLLVVSVSNEFSDQALPYKRSFDWPNDGGVIRDVDMIIADRPSIRNVHLTPSNNGTVQVQLRCWDDKLKSVEVGMIVKERKSGRQVVYFRQKFSAQQGVVSCQFSVSNPLLWHFDHPNLYNVDISTYDKGRLADTEMQHFGFRELKMKGDSLLLNGEPVRLPGIEWMPGSNPVYGMAEPNRFADSILTDLKSVNAVITRFHWQQDKHIFDWMDEHGMLVMEEVPWWQQPMDYGELQFGIHKQHIREMIEEDYNHPSIFAWGLGNEVWGQDERVKKAFAQLKCFTHTLDSSRLISFVSNSLSYGPANDISVLSDMLTWNEYIGTWHGKNRNELPGYFMKIQQEVPDRALFITEHGLCEPRFTGGDARRIDEMIFHYHEWERQPWVAGCIYFSYNDYRTQMGEDGKGRYRRRVHGITGNYMERKPSFYTLQQLQSPVEVLNISFVYPNYQIVIRCKNTLPSYAVEDYKIITETNQIQLPALKPGDLVTVSLPGTEKEFRILRPTGFEVFRHTLK